MAHARDDEGAGAGGQPVDSRGQWEQQPVPEDQSDQTPEGNGHHDGQSNLKEVRVQIRADISGVLKLIALVPAN